MHQNKIILVPIDFSDCAMDVVRQASDKAAASGSRIALMHVVKVPEGLDESAQLRPEGRDGPVSASDHLVQEARERMPEYVAVAEAQGVEVDVRIEHGEPAEAIVTASKEEGVDRVIMGTHARKGLSKIMLGSVADRVRKQSSRPVEAIPTVYKTHCKAGSCAWCATHHSPAMVKLHAEQDG